MPQVKLGFLHYEIAYVKLRRNTWLFGFSPLYRHTPPHMIL